MKKNSIWEALLRIIIAAATAALTALGTTACMGLWAQWKTQESVNTSRWKNSLTARSFRIISLPFRLLLIYPMAVWCCWSRPESRSAPSSSTPVSATLASTPWLVVSVTRSTSWAKLPTSAPRTLSSSSGWSTFWKQMHTPTSSWPETDGCTYPGFPSEHQDTMSASGIIKNNGFFCWNILIIQKYFVTLQCSSREDYTRREAVTRCRWLQ